MQSKIENRKSKIIGSLWRYALSLWLSVSFTACDSGDIYPDEYKHDSGVVVKASFTFKDLGAFPESCQILFGAFGNVKVEPIVSKSIVKPQEGQTTVITLTNLPEDAVSLKLCLTSLGKQPIYTFYEMDIPGTRNDSIIIPGRDIHLLQFDRVQQQIFSAGCIACHGGSGAGAGKLNMEKGKSWTNLVNVKANKDAGKMRVVPSDIGSSFLIQVLENGNLLNTDHTSIPSKYDDDVNLLKEWIRNGAKNN